MTDDFASPIEAAEPIGPIQAAPTDRPNRRRGRTVLIVGAVLIVAALIVSNVVLWMRYTDTSDKLDQTRRAVVSASTQIKDLSSRMDEASSSIGELPPGKDVAHYVGGINQDLFLLQTTIDNLRQCVNGRGAPNC